MAHRPEAHVEGAKQLLKERVHINLHVDAPQGKIATPIVEVKNVNSFRAVERALSYESQRQFDVWQETVLRILQLWV